jgi:hypothetical protein
MYWVTGVVRVPVMDIMTVILGKWGL